MSRPTRKVHLSSQRPMVARVKRRLRTYLFLSNLVRNLLSPNRKKLQRRNLSLQRRRLSLLTRRLNLPRRRQSLQKRKLSPQTRKLRVQRRLSMTRQIRSLCLLSLKIRMPVCHHKRDSTDLFRSLMFVKSSNQRNLSQVS